MIDTRLRCDICNFDVPETDEGYQDADLHKRRFPEHHIQINEVIGDRWDSVRGSITPVEVRGEMWLEFKLTAVNYSGARIGQSVMVERKRLDRYGMRIFDRVLTHMIRDLDRRGPIR